jgi:hypothetical protein
MLAFANSLTEKLTNFGNGATIVMVLLVVGCVLALTYFGVKCLNRVADQNATEAPSAAK